MLSLACLAVALLPTPAHAGHWVLKLDGSSASASANGTPVSYTPPTGTVSLNPITVFGPSASGWFSGPYSFGTPPSYSATATLTIVLTGTWTADTNSDNTPPPSLMFSVSSSATGYYANNGGPLQAGQANDGFGDPFDPKAQYPGTSDTLTARFKSLDPKTLSLTLTLTASATGGPGVKGGGGANASIGTVTLGIHAQPYNYHQTSVTDDGKGTLTFIYFWSSTSGSLGNLDPSCLVHEYITYPGGSPYVPPPPFTVTSSTGGPAGLANPTITPTPKLSGSVGALTDHQLFGGTNPLNAAPPYQSQTFTATQTYEFDDSATGQVNQPIPGPDAGPLSITRSIGFRPPYVPTWWYSVTKNGTTAWASLVV